MENNQKQPTIFTPDPEERKLLARLINGEVGGYEILFHKYYPSLHAFIRGMTKDGCAAEDITQNVFMKVWVNRQRLEEDKSIRNYLFVVARNEIYNYLRTKNRTFTSLHEAILYPNTKSESTPRNEIEEQLDLDQTAQIVESIIVRMPPQRQRVFRLSRFEHQSSKEIANQLNLSVRTVDKHLELAIRELRRHLDIIPAIILFFDILP